MSKKIRQSKSALILIVALIVLSVAAILCACNKNKDIFDTSACYELDMDYADGSLTVSQEILYVAPDDLSEVILNVYANAFDGDNRAIDILSAQINRKNVDFEIYGKDRTLMKLPCSLKKGQTSNIAFKYTVALPRSDTRLGITGRNIVNLACFYPVVAHYDGGFREDEYTNIGDPFFHDISSFYATVSLERELAVASSGKIINESVSADNVKTVEIEAEHIRDFGMSLGRLERETDNIDIGGKSVDVNYFYLEDPFPVKTMERITRSLAVFSQAYGNYPYSSFTIAQSDLNGAGGMEYGSFATISVTTSRDEYLDVITHEIAHQWWYNVVGNDQINCAWLDEGLAEFSTYYFHYLTGDRVNYAAAMSNMSRSYSAFASHSPALGFNGKMERPLNSFLTDGEYAAVVYFKGALLFDALRTLTGDAKFQSSLRRYFADNMYTVATKEALISAFKSQGYDVSSVVNNWIDDKVKI